MKPQKTEKYELTFVKGKVKKGDGKLGIISKSEPKETILAEIFPLVIAIFKYRARESKEMLRTDCLIGVEKTKPQTWGNGKEI